MIKKNKHEGCKKWMKEVIELNTDLATEEPADDDCKENIEYAEYILEALEKQIPQKPANYIISDFCVDWICPTCDGFHRTEWKMKCCSECGQKIDWSEAE